ncbi:hypothetical protein SDRG_11614 [Saprolegnia diclina VS20]|uniref:Uncharacterized protein n=1 Tax=Saprolegnia diclina (strain VS20) TaxID=1156394 RepID=T0PYD8_SAPDV|nr:hypothetical protein SDRG_11614 [Saprolegnia diclina VS20]EQC30554.1 hypothetical protein SDRG_11614 [Saprolegnia diclina VS20]|eukprot:XP_008615880.1 hypothetical protein SDRG_11614 [Saprolegnia diclina VS20]
MPSTDRVPIQSYAQLLLIYVGALIAVVVTCPFVALCRLLTCYYCRQPDRQRATTSACACCCVYHDTTC